MKQVAAGCAVAGFAVALTVTALLLLQVNLSGVVQWVALVWPASISLMMADRSPVMNSTRRFSRLWAMAWTPAASGESSIPCVYAGPMLDSSIPVAVGETVIRDHFAFADLLCG